MKSAQQQSYQPRLVELRTRLIAEVGSTETAMRESIVPPGNESSLPTHPADRDVEGLVEKLAIVRNEEHLLEQVEAALERIEAGTFGVCEDCGRAISRERLDAIPYTPWCIDCAKRHDSENEPPLER